VALRVSAKDGFIKRSQHEVYHNHKSCQHIKITALFCVTPTGHAGCRLFGLTDENMLILQART
jgi:hypothetical protein